MNVYDTINLMKRLFLLCVVMLCTLSVYSVAYAQFNTGGGTSIDVQLSPENPGPDQNVTVQLESYSTDLNKAKISWAVNGKIQKTATGLRTFSFTTGSASSKTILGISIETVVGEIINKTYTIQPATVDLVWESESFVPPFYKGKALFSHQNKINFVAIPHIIGSNGQEIPAKNLIYKWTRNGTVLGDFSGYGKNTYTMIASVISRQLDVSVEVTSPDSSAVASNQTSVAPVDPMIVLYQRHPLYGIRFDQALGTNYTMDSSNEMSIVAMPFFFGITNLNNSPLSFVWKLNGGTIGNGSDGRSQTFRQQEGTSGTSRVDVAIENTEKILQSASSGLNINFVIPTNIRSNF